MRNLFALVGIATVAFVGLGWYLDWYHLTRQPSAGGTQRFQIDLNPGKITEDVKQGVERGSAIVDKLSENKGSPELPAAHTQPQADQGPASHFFAPAGTPVSQSGWKSLDTLPPAPTSNHQPVHAATPHR